jgi:hypothetical protein
MSDDSFNGFAGSNGAEVIRAALRECDRMDEERKELSAYVARQVCLVERHRHTVSQANTPEPDYQRPRRQGKVVRDGFVGCHDALVGVTP